MSLRHALLGLLAGRPQTGYELTKRFESGLSRYAWHASHSHIYPELKKMEVDGLVEVVDEGPRGARTYAITEPGTTQLREWMFTPPRQTPIRNEFVLRLFMLSALDVADVRELVGRMAEQTDKARQVIAGEIAEIEDGADPEVRPGFARFAAEFGYRWQQMQHEWAEWTLAELEKYETSTNG